MSTGWQCPQCGKCNAPWVAACDHIAVVGMGTATDAPLIVSPVLPCQHDYQGWQATGGPYCIKCGHKPPTWNPSFQWVGV